MTVQLFANLFNVSGIGLILLVSWFVQQNAPSPFFRAWIKAYGAGFLMLVLDSWAQPLGRPPLLTIAEIVAAYLNAWYLIQTARLLQEKPLDGKYFWYTVLPAGACSALTVLLGLPYERTFIAPGLSLCIGFVWLGVAMRRIPDRRAPRAQWLALPLIATGLLPLTFPILAVTPIEWVGYWLGGILNLMTGLGMVVFLLQEAAAQLRQQNEKLVQLDRLKRNFISTVSHELRTPLTSVIGYLEFLEDRIGGPLTPQQAEFVDHMKEGSHQLAGLIDSLLDSHQLEAGALKIKHEEVDLTAVLDQALNTLRSLSDKKGIRLEILLEPERKVWADARRVVQVLNNLIGNAIKFTGPGGTIRISSRLEGDRIRVSVADTGIGIPEPELAQIFDPFFQVDGGLDRKHSGSGLGLSIVRNMVQAMGGEVGVTSRHGEGSVFWFTLPMATSAFVEDLEGSTLERSN
ncbi:MAG TPA: HAMP domain-containing sensor histidine kinase [Stenomitos sp.]